MGGCSLAALNHSYINKSLYLAQKYVHSDIKYLCIFLWTNFVRIHHLFNDANCELQKTDTVQGQIYEHIFPQNRGYCVYHRATHMKKFSQTARCIYFFLRLNLYVHTLSLTFFSGNSDPGLEGCCRPMAKVC